MGVLCLVLVTTNCYNRVPMCLRPFRV